MEMFPKEYYGSQRATISDTEMEIFQSFAESLSSVEYSNPYPQSQKVIKGSKNEFSSFFDVDGCSNSGDLFETEGLNYKLNGGSFSSSNMFYSPSSQQLNSFQSTNVDTIQSKKMKKNDVEKRNTNEFDFMGCYGGLTIEAIKKARASSSKDKKGNNHESELEKLMRAERSRKNKYDDNLPSTQFNASKDRRR
jgi:hypothetical protein